MILSHEDIEKAKSPRGGWTRKQLAAWGVPWPPPKGWRKRLETKGPSKPLQSTEKRIDEPAWHYAPDDAERDRLEMKRLYQSKSGDYSY